MMPPHFLYAHPIDEEFKKVIDLVLYVFGFIGFEDFTAQVSLRDPEKPEKYIGSQENWDGLKMPSLMRPRQKI